MCDFIFREMMKNPDDLGDMELFLDLHNGFEGFYRNVCIEFCNRVLVSALKKSIEHYNQANPERNLNLRPWKRTALCLGKNAESELTLTNSYWPTPYVLGLGSDAWNLASMYIQLSVQAANDNEQNGLSSFAADSMKKSFATLPQAVSISNNETNVWFYYNGHYRNLRSQEAMLPLMADVALFNKNQDSSQPFAAQYVNDLMTAVAFIDQMVAKCDGSSNLLTITKRE
jgi:hypothetical protein